ncbi:hypothetical protein ANCDUO_05902 [Ancylostoma duodenale]|uniref:Reverse transcriptase domain-containing protein n=1 Tax=Ancylostoma duodenale TaxID=51022 RepID=A0A0C2GXK8_9BILA|nr:hypothetical protein ANCDUO_05902 [Ancylostoma duodenale]
MKVFKCILDSRPRSIVSATSNQCGYIKGCGTIDAIYAVRLLVERHRAVHLALLDLEKAFDCVTRELIWMTQRVHGVPEEYVRWIKMHLSPSGVGQHSPAIVYALRVRHHQGYPEAASMVSTISLRCDDSLREEGRTACKTRSKDRSGTVCVDGNDLENANPTQVQSLPDGRKTGRPSWDGVLAAAKVTKQVLQTMEMRKLRWSISVTSKDKVSNEMVRFTF